MTLQGNAHRLATVATNDASQRCLMGRCSLRQEAAQYCGLHAAIEALMRQSAIVLVIAVAAVLSFGDSLWAAEFSEAVRGIQAADVVWKSEKQGSPRKAAPNQWFCFRKEFDLPEKRGPWKAKIACDSKYWLWVNGKLIVFEGQLKRGPSPSGCYYDLVDLESYLQKGENSIAILLWYFGKQGFSHRDSGSPTLLFQLGEGSQSIVSDSGWRALRHPAYGDTVDPKPNYRLPESNIRFDARDDIAGWEVLGYDDSQWAPAIEIADPRGDLGKEFVERPIPCWKDFGLRTYVNANEFPQVAQGQTLVGKLPYNAQVTPYLQVEAKAGLRIGMQTDNYRGGGAPNVRAEYITRDGVQDFESLGWVSGHEVHYSIPAGVKILSLKFRETGYDTEFTGNFDCDDPELNELWKKAQRTLYVTMRDTYMDCPDRERAQWWGDEVIELEEAFYALDPASHHLARKGILELAQWQKPTGQLYSPVPAGNWDKELPTQMLASIGKYGFWNYYRHSGDRRTIEKVYPAVRRYLELWEVDEHGLVVSRKGDWTWGDWGENKDMPLLFNGWYSLALDGYAKMSDLLGEEEEAESARSRHRQLHDSFNEKYWNGQEYRSPNYQGETDERGHALAVLAGIAKPEKYEAIRKVFATEYHASPYMEKYVLEALFKMEYPQEACTRMKHRYRAMIESPLTTLWEGWGIGKEGFGGGTYNHAWSGGPLTLMSKYIAGIEPLEAGYTRFAVRPRLGTLSRVEATVDSVAGKISLAIERSSESMSLTLSVPKGTSAEVSLPSGYQQLESVDEVSRGIKEGIQQQPAKPKGEWQSLTLRAGTWKLLAKPRHE